MAAANMDSGVGGGLVLGLGNGGLNTGMHNWKNKKLFSSINFGRSITFRHSIT